MKKDLSSWAMSVVIEAHHLTRIYQTYQKPEGLLNSIKGFWQRAYLEKKAIENINLKIQGGQIIGLIGANGAGKTTLLKILSGLIEPSSGSATVLGFKPWQRQYDFLKKISILLGQKNQLWWDISPLDSYAMLSKIYDKDSRESRKRVAELAKMLHCEHVLETQLRRLSLGERMKMEIIGALLHEPEIIFLDEPTIGLDIVAQETIRDFLSEYVKKKSLTVILTSHYMDDIAQLASQLLLMSHGHIVYDGTVQGFTEKFERVQTLKVRFDQEIKHNLFIKEGLSLNPGQKEYQLQVPHGDLDLILNQLTKAGSIHDLKIEETDFEDVIHQFLEKESRVF